MTVHRYDPASMRLSINGVEMALGGIALGGIDYASKPSTFSVTLEGAAPRADFDAFLAQLGPPPPLLLDLRLKDRQYARRLRRALARGGCRGRRGAVAVDLARLPVVVTEDAGA